MTFNENMETVNVGIFGHIDHGKTTLLERLSGKWADTHSEEMKRGITIKLGYADIVIYNDNGFFNIDKKGVPVRHVSFVDSPGHEMLMATMLSGAALVDAAILVVAANEGIKPQTEEHFMALKVKQIKNLIVVQNKIDLVTIEQAKKNYQDIKNMLGEYYEKVPIIPVSAQQRVNIDKIWQALTEIPIPKRNEELTPLFIVARSFDVNKPGTTPSNLHGAVLGGTLKQGVLKIGDEIEIKPGRLIKTEKEHSYIPLKTKIRSLFKGSKRVEKLTPGGSMSIETELDMSLAKNDSLSGNLVSLTGMLPPPTKTIKISYKLFPRVLGVKNQIEVQNLRTGEMIMLSVNTSITGGSIVFLKNNELEVALKVPVIVFKGDNLGIARNIGGHWRLIGCGEVI